ncbi:SULP-4 protein [Aphelenchoides avenae]|nr:SULP-4 protein [Aphelenchus avenae]
MNEGAAVTIHSQCERSHFLNQEEFDNVFQFQPEPKAKHRTRSFVGKCLYNFSGVENFVNFLLSFFPILQWLPSYNWKDFLVGDMMAGLTVGVVHVPQGIAYAILTGIDPVYGLYTSFFGVLLYMIFGTSRYVSIGSFAIISLMTGVSARSIYDRIEDDYLKEEIRYVDNANMHNLDINLRNFSMLVPKLEVEYAQLVQVITLTSGLIQIGMGLLRIEFLAAYLSDQLVSGFVTAAAIHVVVVQSNRLLQVSITRFSGPGYLLKHMFELFQKLQLTNPVALAISACSFIFLYIGKDHINGRFRQRLPAPIPFELLLVLISTAFSSGLNLRNEHNITVVKEVPSGLPQATVPRFDMIPYVFWDSLEIAFVVVALHLSMCKVFNRKLGTKTDNNQELYAIGLLGSLSSFFNTYPVSSAVGRTMLSVECGAKTQLSAFFTASLLFVVILFLGPLLSSLPMCVLAAIIIYSMKGVFQKMPSELAHLWRVAKIDFVIWIVSFVATVVLNVMQGLAVAVIFALLTTIFRIQWPRWRMLSRLSGTEDFRDSGRYARVQDVEGVRVFRFDAPLLFMNVDHFASSVEKAVTACTTDGLATLHNVFASNGASNGPKRSITRTLLPRAFIRQEDKESKAATNDCVQHLVIDCSGFTFVDYSSVVALADAYRQMKERGIMVYFAGAKAPIRDVLDSCGFHRMVGKDNFYPSIYDAVLAATTKSDEPVTCTETDVPDASLLQLPTANSTLCTSKSSGFLNSKVSLTRKDTFTTLDWERKHPDELDDL